MSPKQTGPLSGYRILELCSTIAGPFSTMLLADQGADVIKVESGAGDQGRHVGYTRKGVSGAASMFVNINRNKRSIVLDLKAAKDQGLAREIARQSDVVVQNYRPGVMERLGLGYDDLKAQREDIIYVSISGVGEHGPGKNRRVYDAVVQGIVGFASVQADRETGEPRTIQNAIADKVGALVVWQAVTAALLHRERTGEGQHVKVNLLDAGLSFLWPEAMGESTFIGGDVRAGGAMADVRYAFKTKDDYVIVGFVSNDEFAGLCRAIEVPDLADDPRFNEIALRFANASALNAIIAEHLETRTSAEWLERFAAQDCVYAPVNRPSNIHLDPQIIANEALMEMEHPVYGRYRQPAHPIHFSRSAVQMRHHAPMLGEHTSEVLKELGLETPPELAS